MFTNWSGWFFTGWQVTGGSKHITGITNLGIVALLITLFALYKVTPYVIRICRTRLHSNRAVLPSRLPQGSQGTQS